MRPGRERQVFRVAVPHAGIAGTGRVLPASGFGRFGTQPHRLRPVRVGRCPQPALRGTRQLLGAAAPPAVLGRAGTHPVLRDRGRAAVDAGLARRRVAAELASGEMDAVVPHRTVRAGGDDGGRGGGDLALPVQSAIRRGQLRADASRVPADRLAGQPALGYADDHPVRGVEELRLQHDHPAGRPAGDPRRPVRSRAHRRRIKVAAIPAHHPARARTDPADGRHPYRVGLFPAVRGTLRDHRGRPAAEHGERAVPDVQRRLQVVEHGHGVGGRVPAVPRHVRRDRAVVALRRRPRGNSLSTRRNAWLVNIALALCAALVLFPLFWMLSVSFMQPGEADNLPPPMLPLHPTLANYRELFAHAGMGRYFANSLIISTAITLLSLVCNTLAGYAFAKLHFAGREKLFGALIGALVIPAQVAMVAPVLLLIDGALIRESGAVTLLAMASVFGIFLVRQYARGLPGELLEAARVDGAGEARIFVQIVLPLLKPILVTLAVFTFLTAWNDFMWPLIALTGQQHYTLPVGLASLSREHVQDSGLMMAGAVVTVIPVLVLFLALQRYYLRGLLLGSVKG